MKYRKSKQMMFASWCRVQSRFKREALGNYCLIEHKFLTRGALTHVLHSYKHGAVFFSFLLCFSESIVFPSWSFFRVPVLPRRVEAQEPPRRCHPSLPFSTISFSTCNTNRSSPAVAFINEVRSCSEEIFLNGLVFRAGLRCFWRSVWVTRSDILLLRLHKARLYEWSC